MCATTASAGSRTSSKNSANCFSGPVISTGIGVRSKPGASVGTTTSAGCSVPVRASWDRATTSTACASSTPEMYVLRPLRTMSGPSSVSVVVIWCEFEPASGSVIAKAIFSSPEAIPGSQRRRCSSVPERAMTLPQIAGETTSSSSGQPAAASSSQTIDSSRMPRPPPPYSSGTLTPR